MSPITQLISRSREGDREATKSLFEKLYIELKQMARGQLAGGGQVLHATSLVHEAFCKLARGAVVPIQDREHFYAVVARVMRQVVVDQVRARDAQRRGGARPHDSLDSAALAIAASDRGEDVLALDAALEKLAVVDERLANLVELKFYGGLELTEITGLLGRSERSLKRDWRRARAFLYREMNDTA